MILTIQGNSVEEIKGKLLELVALFGANDCHHDCEPGQVHLPLVTEAQLTAKVAEELAPAAKEKKTTKKAEPTVPATAADARKEFIDAMKYLTATEGGMAKALKILKDLGVQRVSQVPEDKYNVVLEAVKAS